MLGLEQSIHQNSSQQQSCGQNLTLMMAINMPCTWINNEGVSNEVTNKFKQCLKTFKNSAWYTSTSTTHLVSSGPT